jgi:hypothetical protein
MIGANRAVDKDWSEFENYATNLYARSLVTNQSLSASAIVPSKAHQEQQQPSNTMNNNNPQFQMNTGYLDVNTITDDIASVRKAVLDLRNHSEEVRLIRGKNDYSFLCCLKMNRCMEWMMEAMERVKMSKAPKPRLTSAITINGLIY